jgi:hypothetical protein
MSTNPFAPVMYYSNRCEASKEIIQTLQGLNKASLYRFVCIDTTPRHLLPAELHAVPSVYNPQTKEMLSGKQAIFAQIAKPVQARREIPTERAQVSEPGAWSFNNTGSLTDPWTSFDDGKHFQDDQLLFSYLTPGSDGDQSGLAGGTAGPLRPDQEGNAGSKTGRNNDVSSRLEQYQNMRAAEFKPVART